MINPHVCIGGISRDVELINPTSSITVIKMIIKSCNFNITETYYNCLSKTNYELIEIVKEDYKNTVPQCMSLHNRENEIIEDFYQSPIIKSGNRIDITGFAFGHISADGKCQGERQRFNQRTYQNLVMKIHLEASLDTQTHDVVFPDSSSRASLPEFSTVNSIGLPTEMTPMVLPDECRYTQGSCTGEDKTIYYWEKVW